MKTINILLLIFVIIVPFLEANPISEDAFRKMNPEAREKAIEEAPPPRREQLRKIDHHLLLLSILGGEAALKRARETSAAQARGLPKMEGIFVTQVRLWDSSFASDEKLHYLHWKYLPMVHSLVFNLAPSPAALALEKKVEKLDLGWRIKYNLDGKVSPITKDELAEVDNECEQILTEIEKLPKLTPAEAQKEYDEFTDDKVQY